MIKKLVYPMDCFNHVKAPSTRSMEPIEKTKTAIISFLLPIVFLFGQGTATLVVTGSVHGQLDPCG